MDDDKFFEESEEAQLQLVESGVSRLGEQVSRLQELVDQIQLLEYSKYICPICIDPHPRSHRQNCELLALLKEANKGFADLYK